MFRYVKSIPYPIWLITCAHAVTDLSSGALFVALPFFKAKFGLSYAELTAVVLLQSLTSSVSQPIFGYLSDRKSRPWWMPFGCFIAGAMMLVSLLVPTYPLVLLCTAVSGFGGAIFHPEGAKIVNWLSGKAKGKGASVFSVGGNAGFALGSLFLGTLLIGSPTIVYLFIVPNIVVCILLLLVLKQLTRLPQRKQGGSGKVKVAISMNLPLLALLGMVLARSTVNSGISTFVPLYYTSFLHGNSAYAASLLTVYLAAGAAGTLLGGPLSDRYGSKKVMLYSILPVAPLLYLFKVLDGVGAFILLALVSILLAATFTSSLVMAQKMMPGNIAMASGLTLGFSIGLGAMGVLALGHVADTLGLSWVFNLLSVLPIAGFILTLFVQEPDDASAKQPVPEVRST
ncbi:MFS transporter [Desulforamulus aeronauticus]|uniref:MFS transporter, FSR family, fosmidomycin resistance protein n=1 Tax=Desulforamulus aeronauticus DSM 10349 TaxID=1121421 RepID=A0A1M6TIQ5_9FIRM|nr:MFS transporter [Desulforamulus aeronauticus]SHK56851.1 MFS transporter, FSR family, fosmidomycin resistance protein [Desulforamulus aeronauticus DSM 10349]